MTVDEGLTPNHLVSLLWSQAFVMKCALWLFCLWSFSLHFQSSTCTGVSDPSVKIWAQCIRTCSSQTILEINIFVAVLMVNSDIHSFSDLFTQSLLYLISTGFWVFCSLLDVEVPQELKCAKACLCLWSRVLVLFSSFSSCYGSIFLSPECLSGIDVRIIGMFLQFGCNLPANIIYLNFLWERHCIEDSNDVT